jgi:hypothetical protein
MIELAAIEHGAEKWVPAFGKKPMQQQRAMATDPIQDSGPKP